MLQSLLSATERNKPFFKQEGTRGFRVQTKTQTNGSITIAVVLSTKIIVLLSNSMKRTREGHTNSKAAKTRMYE